MKPRVAIIKTDGTNCDYETAHAFERAGAQATTMLLTDLLHNPKQLSPFQIIALPGGFSYGDDIASGKIMALELELFLQQELEQFINEGKLIIGICNGFQVLVRAKLLPYLSLSTQKATLLTNDSNKFECRWVELKAEKSSTVFTQGLDELMLPVAHAEGKFFATETDLDALEKEELVALRYAKNHQATQEYPANPNGSLHAIAGITDKTGRILGLMPHPERFIYGYQHPERTRRVVAPAGLKIFENAVNYVRHM